MFDLSLCWSVVWLVSLLSSFLFCNLVVSMRGWLVCSFVGWWFVCLFVTLLVYWLIISLDSNHEI